MKRTLLFLMTAVLLAGCSSGETQQSRSKEGQDGGKEKVLNFHCIQSDSSIYYKTTLKFGEMLEENSGGKLKVKVYPNGSLCGGDQTKSIEMIQKGTIDMGLCSGVVLASVIPDMNLTCMPWVFDGFEGVDAALSTGTRAFELYKEQYEKKDLIMLGMAEHGFRQLDCSKKTIQTPEDLKNLKLRVLGNPVLNELFVSYGANPTNINPSEIYTSLQNGTIDGEENPILYSYPAKLHEVSPYFTIWNYSYDVHPLIVGKAKWESFTEEEKEIIQRTADEWIVIQKQMMREAQDEYIEKIKEEGGSVYVLSEEELNAFKAYADPIVEKYIPQFSSDVYEAIINP